MNKIINDLQVLGLSTKNSLSLYNARTRDMDNLNVLKCNKSDVIVLEEMRLREDYYDSSEHYHDANKNLLKKKDETINIFPLNDDQRRFDNYKELIANKSLLDFGSGKGEFLRLCNDIVESCAGVELEGYNRRAINQSGIECTKNLDDLTGRKFNVITLNHVFEHLIRPLDYIIKLADHLEDDGTLIIEVPHARDLLLSYFDLQEFKDFTFWSEHLILHTKESLEKFVTYKNKFKVKKIAGFQRYPITNHYHWLYKREPSGHNYYSQLNDDEFHKSYSSYLEKFNMTDTIIGFFGKS